MLGFIGQKLGQIFSNFASGKKDSQAVEKEVFNIFMEADVPFKVAQELSKAAVEEFSKTSKNALRGTVKADESLKYSVCKVLTELFDKVQISTNSIFQINKITVVFGSVGSGKTTSVAKLALYAADKLGYKKNDILVVSVDDIRNAGAEQLEILSGRVGTQFADLSDRKSFDKEFLSKIRDKKLVFIDTPGQWTMDQSRLPELKSFIDKIGTPVTKICIIDSMMGQASLSAIGAIEAQIGINAAVLTKVDSEAKGGVAVGFVKSFLLPIAFICDGEGLEDIKFFHSKQFVQRLLGHGDIEGLCSKIESSFKKLETSNGPGAGKDQLLNKIKSGEYDFDALLGQIEMMQSMGPLSKLVSYLPGMGGIDKEVLEKQQLKFERYKVIVQSMTPKERRAPGLVIGTGAASRRSRIIKGCGSSIAEFDEFLKEFAIMKKNIKMMSSFC